MAEVYFDNIKSIIDEELSKVRDSLKIAMAWFTDELLLQRIVNLSKKGIMVEILINDDEINFKSETFFKDLFVNGGMVYFPKNQDRLMHNKFAVIDTEIVLSGSFNWTSKANYNNENLTVFNDNSIAKKFIDEFQRLKESSEKYTNRRFLNLDELIIKSEEFLDYEKLIQRAKNRLELENYIAALSDYKNAFEISQDYSLWFEIASCQSLLKNYHGAVESYTNYLKHYPNNEAAYYNRGLEYMEIGEFGSSISDFTKAIQINPEDYLCYLNRANAYSEPILNETEIIAEYGYDPVWNRLKEGHKDFKKHYASMKEAIIDYTKAIELNPIIAKSAYNKIADLKYKFREYEDSIIYYSKVLNLSSNDSRPYYDRAWSYYLIDNLTDAISDITHAIRIEQTNRSYKEALSIFKKEKRKIKNWFN